MKRETILFLFSRLCLISILVIGATGFHPQTTYAESSADSSGRKHYLFHIKTSLKQDDAQICVAPNLAWAALEAGHRVTLLFDGSAVTSVRNKWRVWGPASTDMDRAALPDREKQALAEQFHVAKDTIPDNYGDYLEFLKSKGAHLVINKTMTILYKIDAGDIDPVLTPISLGQMIEYMDTADVYVVY